MADYNSSLPVVGSQAITNVVGVSGEDLYVGGSVYQVTDPWIVEGSVAITSPDPLPISGEVTVGDIAGSVAITSGWINVAASGAFIPISGEVGVEFANDYVNVVQSGTQWLTLGSARVINEVLVTGSVKQDTDPWIVLGSVNIDNEPIVTGSVIVTNTVAVTEGPRDSVQDYDQSSATAANGSAYHWYVTNGSFYFTKLEGAASGKAKFVIRTGSPTPVDKAVVFNSTATPNVDYDLGDDSIYVGSNTGISIVKINRDTSAQDLYSTIIGYVP